MVNVAILAVLLTAFLALCGWMARRLLNKYKSLVDRLETVEEKSNTVMTVLFGREVADEDVGFTQEVEDGLESISKNTEALDEELDDVKDVVEIIVIRLDKNDEVDFDKDEIDSIAELRELQSEE